MVKYKSGTALDRNRNCSLVPDRHRTFPRLFSFPEYDLLKLGVEDVEVCQEGPPRAGLPTFTVRIQRWANCAQFDSTGLYFSSLDWR